MAFVVDVIEINKKIKKIMSNIIIDNVKLYYYKMILI